MKMSLFCSILAALGTFGCSYEADQEPASREGAVSTKAVGPTDKPLRPTIGQDLKSLVEGNNAFAFDLYHRLRQQPGNKFFSPYSISSGLAMTYAGAKGNTAKEMAQTLHFALVQERLHPAFRELARQVQGTDRKRNYELAIASSLWGPKGLSLDPKFLRITQTDYQAGFSLVDFANDVEGARQRINGWVENETKKRITDLLQKGLLGANTRLVLVNAIHFKGDWALPFPNEATKPGDFIISGSEVFKVAMMNRTFEANYMETADFQLAELLYKDNELSAVVILPKKKDGLPEVERTLSAKALSQSLSATRRAQLQVTLPKFEMTEEFALGEELATLGMKEAFSSTANFSGMSHSESLFISKVAHKSFFRVDEMGTEAAAANAVVMDIKEPATPISFRADHPFFFLVRHNATGSILFVGRVFDPRTK